jgi:hypothetical protein
MRNPEWIKKLGGHAGELYVAAELSKRGILNSLLPENFSDDDILIGKKDGDLLGYIQVKSYHPDRGASFRLSADHEKWIDADDNKFVVLVCLGSSERNEPPKYWIATKKQVGEACQNHPAKTRNRERRFYQGDLDPRWENNWNIFDKYKSNAGISAK